MNEYNSNEPTQEHIVSSEELIEAWKAKEKADTNYWYLYATRQKQRNPNTTPESIYDILNEKPKKGEYVPPPNAVRTQIEPNYIRYDEGSRVMDLYTDKDGRVWELPWNRTTIGLTNRVKATYDGILDRYKDLDWNKAAMTEIKCPCATDGCSGYTWQTINDIRRITSDNYEREEIKFLFCDACRSGKEYVDPLVTQWRETCPVIFQRGDTKTDLSQLPQTAYAEMKEWGKNIMNSTESLYVFGDTGRCKSRMMYLILYHCVVKNHLSFKVYRGGEYSEERNELYSTRYNADPKNRMQPVDKNVDVLVFDDFGQDELSPTKMTDLWMLIDYRMSKGLRNIFLSNFAPADLIKRYGRVFHMDSMVRRLDEFSKIVAVNLDPKYAPKQPSGISQL